MQKIMNKILLIYDLAGYGKVALSAMIPIFSHLKCETFNLPTALVSNTFDYGKFEILDTTEYIRGTVGVWNELGFSFDAICTGFIASREQAELVTDYCRDQKERYSSKVFVDPVMADNGVLYNGLTMENVTYMRGLCATADVVLPNITEACFLTGVRVNGEERRLVGTGTEISSGNATSPALTRHKISFVSSEIDAIVAGLKSLGAKNVIITSANLEGHSCTIVGKEGEDKWIPFYYNEIPAQFAGTGDIFTSLVTAAVMHGKPLEEAVRNAVSVMEYLISENSGNEDKYKGIPIEQYLEIITI